MSRTRPSERHLVARSALLVIGGVTALIGMMLDARWLVWVSMVILVSGYALRFARVPEDSDGDPDEVWPEEEGQEPPE